MSDPGDVTLCTYQAAAARYVEQCGAATDDLRRFLTAVGDYIGHGRLLELGSGPGQDADHLENLGVRVTRTDATIAFVELMRSAGHQATVLDVRTDDLGTGYDGIYSNAMLHHLSRDEFEQLLRRSQHAVVTGGLLAFTVKEGDGEAWSVAKLDQPRHFTYWREPALRDLLSRTGWAPVTMEHVLGRVEPWLYVIARAG